MITPMLQVWGKQYLLMHFNLDSSDALIYSGVFKAPQGVCLLSHFILFTFCSCSHWRNKGKLELWKLSYAWCLEEMLVKEPVWGPYWGSLPAWVPSLALSCFMPQAVSCPSSTFWIRVLGDPFDNHSNQMNYGVSKVHLHLFSTSLGNRPKGIPQNDVFHDEKDADLHHKMLGGDFLIQMHPWRPLPAKTPTVTSKTTDA